MTSQAHTLLVGTHRLDVELTREEGVTVAALRVDGVDAARATGWPLVRIPVEGIDEDRAAVVATTLLPGRGSVRLVVPPAHGVPGARPERIDFEPPAGTRAHRRYHWAREHPRLYAARHVAVALAQVLGGLLLARVAIGLVLDLDLPRIPRPDLPDLPGLPDLPWPDIDLPDWSLPGWLAAVLASKKYWFPILVAVVVAAGEVKRRRRRQQEQVEREDAAWPGPSTPPSTPPGGSSSSTPDSPASRPTATTGRRPR